ncbi:MAG: type III-A CRISPR-associated protein Cas10/Csm1 [Tannerellaceae bacterium]|nr:type III-A CRISPR-associated protein Cas10/Csm1 [Tannerellaceae bacterium]
MKELDLFQANIIYNSGGGFYLIAPNTEHIRDGLLRSINHIERKFFDVFGTALFMAIDYVPVSKESLMHVEGKDLRKIWSQLFDKKDQKKSCRFASLIKNEYHRFFSPTTRRGDALRDVITGEEFFPDERSINIDAGNVKQETNIQIQLGKILRESVIMVVSTEKLPYWKGTDIVVVNPAELGFFYYFLREENLKEMSQRLQASVDNVHIVVFNNRDKDFSLKGKNNIYKMEFYGGNQFNGDTFDEMAKNPNFSRMGILRMDVDNLGSVFRSGIPSCRATLSRFAALSRSFDYFFSGYLNTIWEETSPEKSFIIYSGGDDLFIVGAWDITIQIAKKIRKEFKEFTCFNPAFTISGGIAIFPAKFPIMRGASESANEENRSKKHTVKYTTNKNAISFMGMPLHWEKEFPVVEKLKENIVKFLQQKVISKSFISKIMTYADNANIKNHEITQYKTYWIVSYDLTRFKEDIKEGEVKKLIDNCIVEICGNKPCLNGEAIDTDYHALELWTFATRWAELETRINNSNK